VSLPWSLGDDATNVAHLLLTAAMLPQKPSGRLSCTEPMLAVLPELSIVMRASGCAVARVVLVSNVTVGSNVPGSLSPEPKLGTTVNAITPTTATAVAIAARRLRLPREDSLLRRESAIRADINFPLLPI
jgi:hypothetical protein